MVSKLMKLAISRARFAAGAAEVSPEPPAQLAYLSSGPNEVHLGEAVEPPVCVEAASAFGDRVVMGASSRPVVRLDSVPALRLSGNVVRAVQGRASFHDLRIEGGMVADAVYCWQARLEAGGVEMFAVSHPPFRALPGASSEIEDKEADA